MTLRDVLDAHEVALQFGGHGGIRDLGLIQSAIARPYSGYYPSLHGKAAALLHSLAKNHGFVDGNKRASLLAVTLFLDRSGARLTGPNVVDAVEQLILGVVENRVTFDKVVDWFKERIVR